jgi:PHS family inorganic phosphate transporter-like MFS transporter
LFIFRFILGLGVGGDYPLSATLMSEYSSKKNRGALVGAVFAMQGTGYLGAATVAIIFSSIWDASPDANPDHLWRIILAFGAIPTALTLYARLNMPETPRYTMFVNENATQVVEDMNYVLATERARSTGETVELPASLKGNIPPNEQRQDVKLTVNKQSYTEFISKFWKTLLGTSLCWFFLDIAFYSQSLTQSTVFSSVGWLPQAYTMSITEEAYRIARAQAIVSLASIVPGYWCTVFTVEHLGRWKIQLGGFLMMTLFMAILAGDYDNLVQNHASAFVGLYCMTFFFANWGPNSTTFIIPSEVFPTQYRALGHGISAACGKAGAIIGTFGFLYMQQDVSTAAALSLLTAVNGVGFLCTFLVPETKGKSLEELTDDKILPGKKSKLLEDDTEGKPTQIVISRI